MQRSVSDWGGNIVAYAVMILLNVLSNALPINDQTMPEISAKYPSLFTPAGFTFSIWGVIYLALLVFLVWQALPAQRGNAKIAAISHWFKLNCLVNALWIVVWHYDLVIVSLLVMLAILVTLILVYRSLIATIADAPWAEHLALYLPFSIYTGWITLATIANASVVQTAYGLDDAVLGAVQWTLLKLAAAGAIGATMILRLRDAPFALVIAWGAYGIASMQTGTPAVAGAALTLSLLMLILAGKDGLDRLLTNRS
jgi:benzodiazapine receptor